MTTGDPDNPGEEFPNSEGLPLHPNSFPLGDEGIGPIDRDDARHILTSAENMLRGELRRMENPGMGMGEEDYGWGVEEDFRGRTEYDKKTQHKLDKNFDRTTTWCDKNGTVHRIRNMSTTHLMNVMGLLERCAKYRRAATYRHYPDFQGEMAQYYAETEWEAGVNFHPMSWPVYEAMFNELVRRGHEPEDGHFCYRWKPPTKKK